MKTQFRFLSFLGLLLAASVAQAQWTTATLSQARSELAAASAGGKVFFAGGSNGNQYVSTVDIYDVATNTWTTANLSQARSGLAAASVGGKVFFGGGFSSNGYSAVVDIYDVATNTWTTASLSQARYALCAISAGNKVFFAGGIRGGNSDFNSHVVDIYDLATNTWSVASLWMARDRIGATAAGNKVFFGGGNHSSVGPVDVVDVYDLTTNTWSQEHLSQKRWGLGATSVGTKAFFGGGAFTATTYNLVDVYDTATNTWTTASLSQARTYVSAASMGTKAFFGGGANSVVPSAVVDIYDAGTNTWSASALSQARSSVVTASASGKVFFAGGTVGNSGVSNVVDIYTVGQPTFITQQPAPAVLNACAGTTVSSTLVAAGALSYQWYKKVAPADVALPTQTTATLTLANLQASDAGTYYCVLTGEVEAVVSNNVTVTVATPGFTAAPAVGSVAVCAGESITMSFAASCFAANNVFTAQLSDGNGSFANPVNLGAVTPGTNALTIPVGTPTGSNYQLRVLASNPGAQSAASGAFAVTAAGFVGKPTVSGLGCAGQGVQLQFAVGCFPAGTTFSAELSDASGSFANPVGLGAVTPGTNNVVIPAGAPGGTGYRVRVQASGGATSSPSAEFQIKALKLTIPGVAPTPVCAGQNVTVSFGVEYECPFAANNVFTAQLSNASGSFNAPVSLGTVNPGSNPLTIPFGTPAGTGYRIRVVASNPALIGPESANFEVKTPGFGPTPLVELVPVCAGNGLLLTFGLTCPFPPGTVLTAEISDLNGSFAAPTALGSVSPGATNGVVPASLPAGNGYRIRVKSSTGALSAPSAVFQVNALSFAAAPTVSGVPVCVGKTFTVNFSLGSCPFPAGNVFTAQLSSAAGSFAAPTSLGSVVPGANSVTVPANLPAGSGYRVRIVASNPALISPVSGVFTVNQPAFGATVTVGGTPVCKGSKVTLSFTTVAPCAFGAGNVFKAQLSDANGNFAAPVSLGVVVPGGDDIAIPANTPAGTGYKIRVLSNNPALTSPSSAAFKVNTCLLREIAPEATGLRVLVSPNPSPEGRLRIQVNGATGQSLHVELFNSSGLLLRQETVENVDYEAMLDWDIARQPGGLYLLRVSGEQEAKTVRVLR